MHGKIVSFDGADGLGTIELEDGRRIRFGLRDCAFAPVPGLAVDVPEVVPGILKGQLRASKVLLLSADPAKEWAKARIESWNEASGVGTVRREDGVVASFGGATRMRGRVRVRPGEEVRVRCAGEAVLELDEATPAPSLEEALARAQEAGLGRTMTTRTLRALRADVFGDDDEAAELFPILDTWYHDHPDLGVADGWVHHDWRFRNEVEDPIAELATLSRREPLLHLIALDARTTTARGHQEDVLVLRLRTASGSEVEHEARSYADVVDRYNAALAEAGERRRFVSLDTQGDFFAYAFLDPDVAKRLAADRVLPFES